MAKYDLGQLVWKITGDDSGLNKSLDRSEKKVKKTGKGFSKLGGMAKAGFAIAGVAAVALTKKLVKMASDAEEINNKFAVVFKGMKKEADTMVVSIAENYGIAKTETKKLLSETGSLLTGLGFSTEAMAKMSKQVVTLSADLASFNNMETADVANRIRAALTGETDGLKALDTVVVQSSKSFQDLVKKKVQLEGKTLQQAKAEAILGEVVKQNTIAIGDFARSQGSFANQTKILQARLRDVGDEIGKEMLPGFTRLVSAIVEATKQGGFLLEMFKGIGKFIGFLAKGVANLVTILGGISKALKSADAEAWADAYKQVADDVAKKYFDLKKKIDANPVLATPEMKKKLEDLRRQHLRVTKLQRKSTDELSKSNDDLVKSFSRMSDEANKTADASKKNAGKSSASFNKFKNTLTATGKAAKGVSEEMLELGPDVVSGAKQAEDAFESLAMTINEVFSTIGQPLSGLFTALSELSQAQTNARIDDLDRQMEKELEAAGVAEETAVQKAEKELELAKETGDEIAIKEKQDALTRAQIQEKFEKEKAKAEYKGAVASWEFQKAAAIVEALRAPLAAFTSGLNAPWPLTIPVATAQAGLAAATAGIQLAAVEASKPKKPRFQDGGIVPGTSTTGDTTLVRANAGELIANEGQQQRLLDIADGRVNAPGANNAYRVVGVVSPLWDEIFEASQDGRLLIADKAVTEKF